MDKFRHNFRKAQEILEASCPSCSPCPESCQKCLAHKDLFVQSIRDNTVRRQQRLRIDLGMGTTSDMVAPARVLIMGGGEKTITAVDHVWGPAKGLVMGCTRRMTGPTKIE